MRLAEFKPQEVTTNNHTLPEKRAQRARVRGHDGEISHSKILRELHGVVQRVQVSITLDPLSQIPPSFSFPCKFKMTAIKGK